MRVPIVIVALTLLQGPPPAMPEWARDRPYFSSGSHIASPTVVATWMLSVHRERHTLDLLVLWRGTPGWFLEGNGHRSSGGGSGDKVSVTIEYAGRPLTVTFDRKARVATVQGRSVDLHPDLNVVLVDGVDAPGSPPAISTLRVDDVLPAEQPPRLPVIIQRSDRLLQFLQCDLRVPQPSAQRTIEMLCAQAMGR